MSTHNSNSNNEKELMNGVFAFIFLIIFGYLLPIIGSVMLPLLFSGFTVIVSLLLGWPMDGVWDETVEYIVLFANFGKIFSPIGAIVGLMIGILETFTDLGKKD